MKTQQPTVYSVNKTKEFVSCIGVCGVRIFSGEEWEMRLAERGETGGPISLIPLKQEFKLEVQVGLLRTQDQG